MAQYYMLHKPRGLLTAKRDARRETVMSCFPEALRETLHPVGRLDKDTEGLLLFTDDGMLDVRLLRPEQHVEKEYEYRAFGHLHDDAMRQLETGVLLLAGQPPRCRPARSCLRIRTLGKARRICRSASAKKYLKNPSRPVTLGRLWITEGRKHQVKLMIKAVGGHVFYLKRLAIGPVRLDEMLRPGEYRPLTAEELAALMPPATNGGGTARRSALAGAEDADKIAGVLHADTVGDLGHRQVGRAQQFLGAGQAQAGQIFARRLAEIPLETRWRWYLLML